MSTRTRTLIASTVPQIVWLVYFAVAVTGCWAAQGGGDWLASFLLAAAFGVLVFFFAIPSPTTFGIPYVPITAVLLVACVVAAAFVDDWSAGYGSSALRSSVVLFVLAVGSAIASRVFAVRERTDGAIQFPLPTGRWLVFDGEGRLFNHHWVAPAQRAALDLVMVDGRGSTHRGIVAGDYYAFGLPVSSPVDGTVVRCGDGLEDGWLNPRKPAGNHVVVDNGHEHILIAHLKKDSVLVTQGQRVTTGQQLGLVGNSGNSTEPHLHIHAERDGRAVRIVFDGIGRRMWKGRRVGR